MEKVKGKIIFGDSREMPELQEETIDLVITSPPYWHIKDYGIPFQIGYGQSLHEYLKDLYLVWKECFRVLRKGARLCINVGDQFARAIHYGTYKVIPIHAEVILQCEKIGFDFMGSIIWQKKTTMNTTGGAVVMGSFPYPPNGIVEIDYEFILIFKKPGPTKKVDQKIKDLSKLTKEEWKEYFSGHWKLGGAKQIGHEAMFPEELPRRLIKMFSFVGDSVLDPFLGSGTTVKVALELGRNAIGYEINREFKDLILKKISSQNSLFENYIIEIVERDTPFVSSNTLFDYNPAVKEMNFLGNKAKLNKETCKCKVVKVLNENTLMTHDGKKVKFLGINIEKKEDTLIYLNRYLLNKEILIKTEDNDFKKETIEAYVYLKNGIFVNSYLIKAGLAKPDLNKDYKLKGKFMELWSNKRDAQGMAIEYSY